MTGTEPHASETGRHCHGNRVGSEWRVDLPLRLDGANASPTTLQGQHQ